MDYKLGLVLGCTDEIDPGNKEQESENTVDYQRFCVVVGIR